MKRLFVAIPISEEVKAKIKPALAGLQITGADLNLVSLENIHFTLKFLGNVDENKIKEIEEKLSALEQAHFSIKIKNVGVFPSYERIKVIWIGAESPELIPLMKKINQELNYIRNEDQEEISHLTIARVKSGKNKEALKAYLQTIQNQEFGEMVVNHFVLYESELTPADPIYQVLKEFKLS